MQVREPPVGHFRLGPLNIVILLAGIALLLVGLSFDWVHILRAIRFPAGELNNPWVRTDLTTLRYLCVLIGAVLIISRIVLWGYPNVVADLANKIEVSISTAAQLPLFMALALATLGLMKTVLQLGLYLIGYTAYGADDFARSLSADYWLYYRKLDLGWDGWLGLGGSGWLPFSDYIFGLALALHRDLYLTPKVVNLVISGAAVIVVYFLGRELFGRAAGLLTACLFAFQPWHVWLGISGMTSDLPSVGLITLYGMFLVRWLRTDAPLALLMAAGTLAVATGFRYENWLFAVVFSVLIVFITFLRWRRGHLAPSWVAVAACALVVVNAFPILWMGASYYVLGDWLPALHKSNAFMVAFMDSSQPTKSLGNISIPILAGGAFPGELALSIVGVGLFVSRNRQPCFRLYLGIVVATFLLFGVMFRGQLAASLVFARYLLPFIVLLLPFAGFLLTQLLRAHQPLRNEGVVTACLILLAIGALDIGRVINYPAMFPKDAVDAGWTIRSLQETGTVPKNGKILIERGTDWGDLGIVAIANRPERFVALNELVYRQRAIDQLGDRPVATNFRETGVRGTSCDAGFRTEACRKSILQERFDLVILSSPMRIASFQDTFHAPSWPIGRYHIFDMRSLVPSARSAQPEFGSKDNSSQ